MDCRAPLFVRPEFAPLPTLFLSVGTDPAVLGNVEDDAVRVLELALEIPFALVAEVEEELPAGVLDAPLGLGEIVDLEAEMVGADEARRVLEVGALRALEIEQGHIDDAVAHVDRRPDVEILALDALELEHLLVELRGLLEILDADRDVTQAGQDILLGVTPADLLS
jgi:hypothetical protein